MSLTMLRQIVMSVLAVVNILECVNGSVLGQYPGPELYQQQQDGQVVGVSPFQNSQTRIQQTHQTASPFVFNGGLSISGPSFYNSQRSPNYKIIGNVYSQSQNGGQGQHQQLSYPGLNTLPHGVNVKVVPKGQPQSLQQIYSQSQPHPQQQQFQQQHQNIPSPTPSPYQYQQNPAIRKVTYLSSVATVNPGQNKKVSQTRPQNSSQTPINFGQVYQPQPQYYQEEHGQGQSFPIQNSFNPSLFRPTPTAQTPQYQQQQQLQPNYNNFQQFHRPIIPNPSLVQYKQSQNPQIPQYNSNSSPPLRVSQSTPAFPNNIQNIIQQNPGFTPAGTTAIPSYQHTVNTQHQSPQVSLGQSLTGNSGNENSAFRPSDVTGPPRRPVVAPSVAYYNPEEQVDNQDKFQYVDTSQYQHPPIKGPVGTAVLNPTSQNIPQYFSTINSNSLDEESVLQYNPQPYQTETVSPIRAQVDLNQQFQSNNAIDDQHIQTPPPPQQSIQSLLPQQYAPQYQQTNQQQQGFQPSNFPQQFKPQGFQLGQGSPQFPFNPQQQQPHPGQNGFPPPPFPPGGPFPPGHGPPGQPPFELENGFNPNHLAPFPEEPYESEFANVPPLDPKDQRELETYSAKRRKSRRRRPRPPNQPYPLISQGSEDVAISTPVVQPPTPSTAEVLRTAEGKPVPDKCAYNTITKSYDGDDDCVEIRK